MTKNENEKTITIDVPEERVPEFYAVFARFLAMEGGPRGRRRGGMGPRGRHGHHAHHGCGPRGRHEAPTTTAQPVGEQPETTEA